MQLWFNKISQSKEIKVKNQWEIHLENQLLVNQYTHYHVKLLYRFYTVIVNINLKWIPITTTSIINSAQ